jgi:hypothetical protein
MRMALFVLLSFALHATELSYPVLFPVPRGELLAVVLLPSRERSRDETAPGSGVERSTGQPGAPRHGALVKKSARIVEATKAERHGEEEKLNPAVVETPAERERVAVASAGIAEPKHK